MDDPREIRLHKCRSLLEINEFLISRSEFYRYDQGNVEAKGNSYNLLHNNASNYSVSWMGGGKKGLPDRDSVQRIFLIGR